MRLWHKDLIPYLPKQQLLGQWRELNSIYKLQNRHILINFVYDNGTSEELCVYSKMIINEMKIRNYKVNLDNFNYYFSEQGIIPSIVKVENEIYEEKMNGRYLKQCLFNLQEKYDCGGISKKEWKIIEDRFKEYLGDDK